MQNDSVNGGSSVKNIIFFEIYAKFGPKIIPVTIFCDSFVFRSENCGIPSEAAAAAEIPARYSESNYRNEISTKNHPIYIYNSCIGVSSIYANTYRVFFKNTKSRSVSHALFKMSHGG